MVKRREFLKTLSGLTAALTLPEFATGAPIAKKRDRLGQVMASRMLGTTSEAITMLGLGGYHFGTANDKEAQALIETSLERGIRFFDCAVTYQNGGSESQYGKFLTPKYRDVVYYMTKSKLTTAKEVERELGESLRRAKTDYLDLWQIHALDSPEDVDDRLDNGVLDFFLKAKEEGKVRHLGFTGHRNPKAHLRMLERTKDTQPFTACQMPINVLDPSYSSFILQVLPILLERKIAPLAMKTLSFGYFFDKTESTDAAVIPDRLSLKEALEFVWSLPVCSLITGAPSVQELDEKIDLARSFSPLGERKRKELIARVADLAGREVEKHKA